MEIWDVFLSLKYKNQIAQKNITLSSIFENMTIWKDSRRYVFYKTSSNYLSIMIRNNNQNILNSLCNLEENKEKLIFRFDKKVKGDSKHFLFLKEINKKMVPQIYKMKLKYDENNETFFIKKNDLANKIQKQKKEYELYLDVVSESCKIRINEEYEPIKFSLNSRLIEIKSNVKKTSLEMTVNIISDNKIRLAILGSCYSRNMFSTRNYFNPDYKEIYEVVFTQFHSAVISAMSNPVPIDLKKTKGLRESNIDYVDRDFNKTIFEFLKNSECQYIILDFFVDATQPLVKTNEGNYVTGNLHLRDTEFLKNWKGISFVRQIQNENYFEKWKEYLNLYMEKLLDIISLQNIILVKGKCAYSYKDIEGKLHKVKNTKTSIQQNFFWERMNNYFVEEYPDVKVLDMTDEYWEADFKHPFGASLVHYSSGFYKEELNRLNKLILKDIIERK